MAKIGLHNDANDLNKNNEANDLNNQKDYQFEKFLGEFYRLSNEDKIEAVLNQPDFKKLATKGELDTKGEPTTKEEQVTKEGKESPYMNRNVQLFYMMRLGMAYAFEYSMLYEMILKSSEGEGSSLGVVSFGCGSCIDAWALAYARARLKKGDSLSLGYWGYDLDPWEISIFDNGNQSCIPNFTMHPPVKQNLGEDFPINDQIELDKDINVLCFPKVLNELKEEDVDTFVETLGKLKLDTDKTYYLCVSHGRRDVSKEGLRKGPAAVKKIKDVFAAKGFTASAEFTDVQSFARNYDLGNMGASFIDMGNGCFGIGNTGKDYRAMYYCNINEHFDLFQVMLGHKENGTNLFNYVNENVAAIVNNSEKISQILAEKNRSKVLKKSAESSNEEKEEKSNMAKLRGIPMKNVNHFVFQIIKLTAKH